MKRETETDELFMRRCIELARSAEGMTYPNPLVGSVIVYDGLIIGEGYHRKAGEPHAEVNAIASVRQRNLLNYSTLYVCLEPCAHFGRTPPCAQLIIDTKIPRVVVGCIDSFSKVSGKGIEMLKSAGVEVVTGVLEEECRWLNRRFFTFHEKHRPFVILKWAESADGFVDAVRDATARPVWLTDEDCRRLVHKKRTEEQAIMIGVNTANLDNPSLTARMWTGNKPLRVVIDPHLRADRSLTLFTDGGKTLVVNALKDGEEGSVIYHRIDFSGADAPEKTLNLLYEMNIQSVIIEGGPITLGAFIRASRWDEAYVYRSQLQLGAGVAAPKLPNGPLRSESINSNILLFFSNKFEN